MEEAADKGVPFINYPKLHKFIVLVGKWAEPIQDELTELLEQEFSLPYIEFVYDHRWDLGHGWSGDMPR